MPSISTSPARPGSVKVACDDHHEADRQQQVGQQGDAGDQAGKAVVDEHEDQHGARRRSEDRDSARLDGVGAEGRPHRAFADRLRLERGRQGAGTEDFDRGVDLVLRGVVHGDLAVGRDGVLNGRRRLDVAVQDDGQQLIDVGLGEIVEKQSAGGLHPELDVAHRAGGRVHHVIAGDSLVRRLGVARQDEILDPLLAVLLRQARVSGHPAVNPADLAAVRLAEFIGIAQQVKRAIGPGLGRRYPAKAILGILRLEDGLGNLLEPFRPAPAPRVELPAAPKACPFCGPGDWPARDRAGTAIPARPSCK